VCIHGRIINAGSHVDQVIADGFNSAAAVTVAALVTRKRSNNESVELTAELS